MLRPSTPQRAGKVVVLLAGLCLLLTACFSSSSSSGQQTAFSVLNRDRQAYGLRAFGGSSMLDAKAQRWAEYLASINDLKHSSLTSGVSGCWRSLGENVGYGSSIDAVQRAYMNSPGHRANILNPSFDRVGVGVAWRGSRVFTVQVFMDAC